MKQCLAFQGSEQYPGGLVCTSPSAAVEAGFDGFAGGLGPVYLTPSELQALRDLYEVKPSEDELIQAGDDTRTLRRAAEDGLRMIAWLAAYCPLGEDPVKTLVKLARSGGYDVDTLDLEWADASATEDD